jgi:hypothetical protein
MVRRASDRDLGIQEVDMLRVLLASVVLIAGSGQLFAQGKPKGIRLWNLTSATITGFQLSPTGKNAWGPNQTLNDKDKEVDHDERVLIKGIEPGRYDAKVDLRGTKECFVYDIEIKAETVFSIADNDLQDCSN